MKKIQFNVLLSILFICVSVAAQAKTKGLGLGLQTASLGAAGNSTLVTGYIPVNPTLAFQPYFGITGTTGSVGILAGTAIKATVSGTEQSGFHVGGNVLLGSISSSFVGIFGGLFGLHHNVTNNILVAVDGGPQFGVANSNVDFSIGAFSSFLGLSAIYQF